MAGQSSYIAILSIAGFLAATWAATKLSRAAGISSIVLEICTGVVLGPSVLGLIDEEYAVCQHRTFRVHSEMTDDQVDQLCQVTPDFFTLIGHAGVALMIFESGLHFQMDKFRVIGLRACAVAVVGTFFPLVTGTLLTMAYGKPFFPDSVSVGTALAPTSVGISLRLLGEAGVLKEDFGQAIITAAFVDDIISLVLFNVLFSLEEGFRVVPVVVLPICGVLFMGVGLALAVKFWPYFLGKVILPRVRERDHDALIPSSDAALFLIMMLVLISYATATHFLGTHLWGCFIGGVSFACLDPPHDAVHVWAKQTKHVVSWMIRIFFAATVAFSIPVGRLLSWNAFLKGSLMGVGPSVLTKVLSAIFICEYRFVIGWAMVGRAEFAFLIAQMALTADMIDGETFSIVIWALVYAIIVAPLAFRFVLGHYLRKWERETEKARAGRNGENEGNGENTAPGSVDLQEAAA